MIDTIEGRRKVDEIIRVQRQKYVSKNIKYDRLRRMVDPVCSLKVRQQMVVLLILYKLL